MKTNDRLLIKLTEEDYLYLEEQASIDFSNVHDIYQDTNYIEFDAIHEGKDVRVSAFLYDSRRVQYVIY